jgi:tRNA-dihydrouridine synthase 3
MSRVFLFFMPHEAIKEANKEANNDMENNMEYIDLHVKEEFRIAKRQQDHDVKQRGQNKKRFIRKSTDNIDLCIKVALGQECPGCLKSHDLQAYLLQKEPDLGNTCPKILQLGYCRYGVKCRFATSHPPSMLYQDEDVINYAVNYQRLVRNNHFNLDRANLFKSWMDSQKSITAQASANQPNVNSTKRDNTLNNAPDDAHRTLESTPPAPQNQNTLESLDNANPKTLENLDNANPKTLENLDNANPKTLESLDNANPKTLESLNNAAPQDKTPENLHVPAPQNHKTGHVLHQTTAEAPINLTLQRDEKTLDVPIKLRPAEKKKLDFCGKTYLAPLTTVGNLPFRRICKEYGVDITCGEMALAHSLLKGNGMEWSLFRRHKSEDFFGVQLTGNDPYEFAKVCNIIQDNMQIDFLDLNLGCPIDAICNRGAGSTLMTKRSKLQNIILGANAVLDCPITVKLRTGITEKRIAHNLIPLFQDWGVQAVTLHGRSKQQRYTRLADWNYIAECASLTDPTKMAFFGNGDIFNPEEYEAHMKTPNVSGIMIGRAGLIKPWIFDELKTGKLYDISSSERMAMLQRFANYGLEHWFLDVT